MSLAQADAATRPARAAVARPALGTGAAIALVLASGLVFGWLAYLLVRAVFTRNTAQIVIAVAVLVVYGSLLWGVLPTQPGVSWQAHLGGALGGALAARLLHGRDRASTLRR